MMALEPAADPHRQEGESGAAGEAGDDDDDHSTRLASPELFAAVATLWHLSQATFEAESGAASPPPLWPMALHAAVPDPLGDADTAHPDSIDAAVLVPLALPLLTCSMQRLQRKAAVVIRKALSAADTTVAMKLANEHNFFRTALGIITSDQAVPTTLNNVLWCLENITAASAHEFGLANADAAGILTACVAMLSSRPSAAVGRDSDAMLGHVLGILGNVAASHTSSRDHVITLDVIAPAAVLLDDDDASRDVTVFTLPAVWLLRNCFDGKPRPPATAHQQLQGALPALVRAVGHAHVEVAAEAAWAISYFTDATDAQRDHFIAMEGAVTRTFAAMQRSDELLTPCLRIAGNLCSGTSAHTRAATEQGLMQAMPFLLGHQQRGVAKEAAWTLSNILADDPKYISLMLHLGVFPHVLQLVQHGAFVVRREAVWCVANAATEATDVDVQGMLAAGVIPALAGVVGGGGGGSEQHIILAVALEALDGLLRTATVDVKEAIVATPGMVDALQALRHHGHPRVNERAGEFFLHFDGDGVASDSSTPEAEEERNAAVEAAEKDDNGEGQQR